MTDNPVEASWFALRTHYALRAFMDSQGANAAWHMIRLVDGDAWVSAAELVLSVEGCSTPSERWRALASHPDLRPEHLPLSAMFKMMSSEDAVALDGALDYMANEERKERTPGWPTR